MIVVLLVHSRFFDDPRDQRCKTRLENVPRGNAGEQDLTLRIPYRLLSKFIIDMININVINKLAKLTVLPHFICLFNDVTSSAYS